MYIWAYVSETNKNNLFNFLEVEKIKNPRSRILILKNRPIINDFSPRKKKTEKQTNFEIQA